jgi:hypothetical protein
MIKISMYIVYNKVQNIIQIYSKMEIFYVQKKSKNIRG